MRVRTGGYSSEGCGYWGIDPSGSLFVMSSGVTSGKGAARSVCECVVRSLLPHRAQLEGLASDIRPDARLMLTSSLNGAVIRADRELLERSAGKPHGGEMTATCDLLFLCNGSVYISHVGHGRVYLIRGDTGRQLTIDHTIFEHLKAQGKDTSQLALSGYKDRLLRALGTGGSTEIDSLQVDLRQGDRLVVCSAGLAKTLQNATHLAQLYRDMEPQRAAEFLVNHALEHGCEGDASAICIEISDPGMRSSSLETDSRITALEKICFFRDLSYQEMLQVMPITFERTYAAGSEIIHEGDEGDELYILVEGECEVTSGGVCLSILSEGASFGELALVDRQPRSATVRTAHGCRVLVIRAADFGKLTMAGALAVKLLWNVAHELSGRLRESTERIRNQGQELLGQRTD